MHAYILLYLNGWRMLFVRPTHFAKVEARNNHTNTCYSG